LPAQDEAFPPAGADAPAALTDSALATLAQRVASGDASAFHSIVERSQHELVRLAARLLGNLADAEDVVQEGYVKAYRALTRGQFDARSSVRTWLYSIVTRTAIDSLRSGRRRRALAEGAADRMPEGPVSPENHLALMELAAVLDRLPPDQRTALVLKSIEGRSSREIGEILGCSEGAVEQRLVRARAALVQQGLKP
jgi:RNA polymerase sigma-70 factor (ECF subfamily)